MIRFAALLCLCLLFVSSYDAIHIHSAQDSALASHHCLLCLAAHLPFTVHVTPTLPGVAFSRSAVLVPEQPNSYDSTNTLFLYTRPPPQV